MAEFDNTRQKIRRTFEQSEDNLQNTNNLEVIDIKINPNQFNKKLNKITLVEGREFLAVVTPSTPVADTLDNFIVFDLQGITDDLIPFTKVVPILSIPEGFILDDITFFYDFNYWWTKVADGNYKLQAFINTFAQQLVIGTPTVVVNIPVFLDLFLYIQNPRIMREYQTNKK